MIVAHEKDALAAVFNHPQAKNAAMKVLIGPQQGWSDYVMRIIELDADGCSPSHAHDWPHINFMLEGHGILMIDGQEHRVQAGSYAYVPANCHHQFKNAGPEKFRFICIVPKEGHQ
jgi:quercetin dioxygenase-like cupin family protein